MDITGESKENMSTVDKDQMGLRDYCKWPEGDRYPLFIEQSFGNTVWRVNFEKVWQTIGSTDDRARMFIPFQWDKFSDLKTITGPAKKLALAKVACLHMVPTIIWTPQLHMMISQSNQYPVSGPCSGSLSVIYDYTLMIHLLLYDSKIAEINSANKIMETHSKAAKAECLQFYRISLPTKKSNL